MLRTRHGAPQPLTPSAAYDPTSNRKSAPMMVVASAGPYANNLHLAPDYTNTTSLNFYTPDALPDAKQQCQSTEGSSNSIVSNNPIIIKGFQQDGNKTKD